MTKILLVEDDKSLREIYGVRLLAEGYDIVSAGDGEEALAMAIKERPELIISDVMMPKISGFDMLDILRSTTETRDIRVVMMTALSSDDQRARGEQLGADRYLVKSQVGIEDVVRTVHEVMDDSSKTAPSATPAPAAAPAPASDAAAPAATPAEPAPATTAAAAPATPTLTPAPSDAHAKDTLPQPTAPFSSPKPDNLGERVINPIVSDTPMKSVADKIGDELAGTSAVPTPVVPPAPAPEPVAVAPAEPTPEPVAPTPEPASEPVASDDTPVEPEPAAPTEDAPVESEPVAPEEEATEPAPADEPAPESDNPDNEQRVA
jgi:CheY-like chemotaxis protein